MLKVRLLKQVRFKEAILLFKEPVAGLFLCLIPIPSENLIVGIFGNYRRQLNVAVYFELATTTIKIFCRRQFLLIPYAAYALTLTK